MRAAADRPAPGRLATGGVAILEQAAASGLSFLIMVLAARTLTKHEFGLMSTAWQVVIYLLTLANGSIFAALMVTAPGTCAARLNAQQALLHRLKILLGGGALAGALGALTLLASHPAGAALMAALAAGGARVALECDRRWAIATGHSLRAVGVSLSAIVLCGLGLLCWALLLPESWRQAGTYILLCAAGYQMAVLLCWRLLPPPEAVPPRVRRVIAARYLRFCRWSLPTTLVALAGGLAAPFILAAACGAEAVADFNATRAFFGLYQVCILGLVLHVTRRQRLAFLEGGRSALWRETLPWITLTLSIGSAVVLLAAWQGPALTRLIFGPSYNDGTLMLILASYYLLLGPSSLLGSAINVTGRLSVNFLASLIAALLTLAFMYPLARQAGISWGAAVLIANEAAILGLRGLGLWRSGGQGRGTRGSPAEKRLEQP